MNRILLLFLGIALLPACYHKKNNKHPFEPQYIEEAKLFDITVPLNAKLYNRARFENSSQITVGFTTNLSEEELLLFYREEMERLGWQEVTSFTANQELLLLFDKPHKTCSILIQVPQVKIYCSFKD